MLANLLLVLIEYQFEQVKMSMCLNRVQGQFVVRMGSVVRSVCIGVKCLLCE